MNIIEADKAILDGQWHEIVEALADACLRYRDRGPIRKNSLIYDKWTERAKLLQEAIQV
jgi:hypothetical protein